MTTYQRFIENNDQEGANWNWWLQVDGNEDALDRLDDYLGELDEDEPRFELTGDEEPREHVDVLVYYADENYCLTHNRVDGVLTLPDELDEEFVAKLYKGGIRKFFTTEAEA